MTDCPIETFAEVEQQIAVIRESIGTGGLGAKASEELCDTCDRLTGLMEQYRDLALRYRNQLDLRDAELAELGAAVKEALGDDAPVETLH